MTHYRSVALAIAALFPYSCGVSQEKAETAASAVKALSIAQVNGGQNQAQLTSFRSANQLFNFAHLVTVEPVLAKLLPYVGPGEAYLYFGDKSKFRVETNLTIDANGGLTDTGSRYISSDYYLDGYIFGRQLTDGSLIDMQAKANFNTMKLTGYVRFLGDDKYNGEIKVGIDKTFMRDLSYDKVVYGVPMLGVNVNATLGGELGMKAAPGLRADQAISASFEPRVKLNGAATVNLNALSFLSARAEGTVELMDLKLSSSAALGLVPSSQFYYANMAVDGATISALDGKIDLYAEADIGGKLPNGVNALLWSLVGIDPEGLQWHHTLWDPAPAYVATLKRIGNSFIGFYKKPELGADCDARTALVEQSLQGRLKALQAEETDDEYLSLIVSSNVTGMGEVLSKVQSYCSDLANGFPAERPATLFIPGSSSNGSDKGEESEKENDSDIWGSGAVDPW